MLATSRSSEPARRREGNGRETGTLRPLGSGRYCVLLRTSRERTEELVRGWPGCGAQESRCQLTPMFPSRSARFCVCPGYGSHLQGSLLCRNAGLGQALGVTNKTKNNNAKICSHAFVPISPGCPASCV